MNSESSKTGQHEAKHSQVDHGFAGVGFPFVVAAESAVTSQPTEGTLYDPSSRQYLEGMQVGTFDDLDRATAGSPSPVEQHTRIATVGPDLLDSIACPLAQRQKQELFGRIPVLNIGGQHHDRDYQTDGVDQNMTLAPVDLFAGVVTPLLADLGALDALAVDDTSTGVAVSPFDQAHRFPQVVVNRRPQTIAFPKSEVVISRAPRCKVSRQVAPLATGFDDVEDGVEQLSIRVFARSASVGGLGETIIDELPFGVGKIRCVSHRKRITCCGTRYKLTLKKSLSYFSNRL